MVEDPFDQTYTVTENLMSLLSLSLSLSFRPGAGVPVTMETFFHPRVLLGDHQLYHSIVSVLNLKWRQFLKIYIDFGTFWWLQDNVICILCFPHCQLLSNFAESSAI